MTEHNGLRLHLKVWRQPGPHVEGRFVDYELENVSTHMSFLEMLDVLNAKLIKTGEDPVAFDHDCREGICGACGVMINGQAHGPQDATTTCQLHMRHFNDGDSIVVEPWRARAFPVVRDLVVDRSAFDRINQAGGFVSVNTGNAVDANSLPISKHNAELAMDAAQCIGCGACVAACKNASAMLYVSAKISHFALLPQGQPERWKRAQDMVAAMDKEGFGNCTNEAECEASCPKEIKLTNMARMNRDYIKSALCESGTTVESRE
jgi:succinate dehydrogenase / fumarate reductase iron-sulfur subunit